MFGKLKAWIAAHKTASIIAVVALIGLSVAGMELTMQPFFCNWCHEMNRVHETWKSSVHAEVGCMECHAAPGLGNLLMAKAAAMKSPYYHFTANPEKLKELLKNYTETPDSACLRPQCHSGITSVKRGVTLAADHQKHMSMDKADCQNCHENVGHLGALPENDLTSHMRLCMTCHAKNPKAPQGDSCDSCHLGEREMLKGEGGLAVASTDNGMPDLACTDCHASEGDYKPETQKCIDCHDDTYATYIADWKGKVAPVMAEVKGLYEKAKAAEKSIKANAGAAKAFEEGRKNYLKASRDGSAGVHNADYAVNLLEGAKAKLNEALSAAK